jgi:hypothetical protein
MWDLQRSRRLISGPETIPRFEAIKKNLGYLIENSAFFSKSSLDAQAN